MNQNLFGEIPDDMAIARICEFAEIAKQMHPAGYHVAFSGGKDSVAVLDLVRRAGVKFTAAYNLTTCDPPELVRFVKTFPDVEIRRPKETMWQLIRRKKCPPRRSARYCCEVLKEGAGGGRMVVTGVRWGESKRRSKRGMVESCMRDKTKRYLHPIIDWSTTQVWEYIRSRNLSYCSLYDEGWDRLGCILCPMTRKVREQMERWPRIAKAWESAIKATFQEQSDRFRFRTAEEYWQWWLDRDAPSLNSDDPNQCNLFDDEGND